MRVGDGRYLLKEAIGHGGMGTVWLAEDTKLSEPLALKFVHKKVWSDQRTLEEMRRETRKSRKLNHPNIVRIHDFHEFKNEAPFISMEYIDGPNLYDLLTEQERWSFNWDYLKPIATQLCAALDYAHDEGVIHRDLKTANLMLDSRDRLKLADFGVAAMIEESGGPAELPSEPTSGTPTHMSPQQMRGEPPSVTDDIYSLGVTLYELCCGYPPFHGENVVHKVCLDEPQPILERMAESGIPNTIPEEVSHTIMACLAKEPEGRPPTVADAAAWMGIALVARDSVVPAEEAGEFAEDEELGEEGDSAGASGWVKTLVWLGVGLALLGAAAGVALLM